VLILKPSLRWSPIFLQVADRRAKLEFFALVFIRMENFRLGSVLSKWKEFLAKKKAVKEMGEAKPDVLTDLVFTP
jgi:hypothetical protein